MLKKFLILVFFIFGTVIFAEKLSTDEKGHLKEILGEWGQPNPFRFYQKNGELWHLDVFNYGYDDDTVPEKVSMINNYTYMINKFYSEKTLKMNPQLRGKKTCFAYDTKKKQLAFFKKCGSDEVQQWIPRKYSTMGG